MTESREQLLAVKHRIEKSAMIVSRSSHDVKLVAVSKTFDSPDIEPILDSGQRVFGENRVQEAQKKWPQLRMRYTDIELHLIGPLQSNKVADAVALFDVIQTVDRPKLVSALAQELKKQDAKTKFLVQVNTGREIQKATADGTATAGTFEIDLNQSDNMALIIADQNLFWHGFLLDISLLG